MKKLTPQELARAEGSNLIAVGVIVALCCGLCSGCMLIKSFDPHDNETRMYLGFVPFVGGIPIAWGLYMIAKGWLIRRGK